MTDLALSRPAVAAAGPSNLYRAVWRWHFYAGLLVLPFLILLAVTGGAYLFRDEIDGLIHRNLMTVEARAAAPLGPQALTAAALTAQPGAAVAYAPAATPTASAQVTVATSGGKVRVYVDPYDGRALGVLPEKGTVMGIVRRLHSLAFFGAPATAAIEIAAGWTIVLVATGIYLWWPRHQTGGVLTIRATPKRRVFWRDLHAVTGAAAGLFIAFLALTGMPWSLVWGSQVNALVAESGTGYPQGMWDGVPLSPVPMGEALGQAAWTLETAPMPQSTPSQATPIGLDAAVAAFERLGFRAGYAVDLPDGPNGVYTASVYPDDVSGQHVAHLDQYSGEPLLDVGFADYGATAKAFEWGISVHMGQEYGLLNQLVMLAACVAVVVIAVSAAVMWWMRRPDGSLGVPPAPADRRTLYGLLAILSVAGALFPLTGASLLAMLGLDLAFTRSRRAA